MPLSRITVGIVRGGFYGLVGGVFLGLAGSIVPVKLENQPELCWKNRQGKNMRFTDLSSIPLLREDLLVIFRYREVQEKAFNEAFRNVQNVISVYSKESMSDILSARKMTNFVIRACKAMEAIHVEILKQDPISAAQFEKAMMNIQLTLEETINHVRLQSRKVLPCNHS